MHRTEFYNFNIDFDRNLGITPIWINFPVIHNGAPVGIIGMAIDINSFVAEMDDGFGQHKKFVIFNESSELLFHENSNLVKNKNYVSSVLPEGIVSKLLELSKQKGTKMLFEDGNAYIIEELPFMRCHIVASTKLDFSIGQGYIYLLVLVLIIMVILLFLIVLYKFIKRIIKPLQHLNNLTTTILKEVPILIAVFSKIGKISLMSRHMSNFLEKNGIKSDNLFLNADSSGLSEYFKEIRDKKGFFEITKEFEIEGKNRYFKVIKMDIEQDAKNDDQNSIIYLSDVSEQMYLANTDSLTNIANRRAFNERANAEFFNNLREKTPIAFLMLDIDFFKQLNDKFGHLVGDNALKEISNILSGIIKRRTDLLGRIGGEEFAIMLHNTDLEGAKIVAEKIRATIDEHEFRIIDSKTVTKITMSIGVYSAVPKPTDDFRQFLGEADKKLYEAKKRGRNRVCY
jgi:diguanylate cyclase (GGDEF)-like protein